MRTIRLRDVEIGSGSPKVIVPIVGKNRGEILTKAQELTNIPLHVVEWRADFIRDVNDSAVCAVHTTGTEGGSGEHSDPSSHSVPERRAVSGNFH